MFGFVVEGVPRPAALVGIVVALVAVVLVTRAPGHRRGPAVRASSGRCSPASRSAASTSCIGQLSGAGAFGPLVVIRLVQTVILVVLIVVVAAAVAPARRDRRARGRCVGLLDMTGNAAFILAIQAGELAIAAVLSSLYPVTTVLLAIVILRERLTRSHVAGIALTAVAIVLITAGTATL